MFEQYKKELVADEKVSYYVSIVNKMKFSETVHARDGWKQKCKHD